MMRKVFSAIAMMSMVAFTANAERPSAFMNQSKPMMATLTMLAVSSSSRQSFAGNREVYLADLTLKHGDHQFVRLIDQYPGFGLPIRDSLLRDQVLFAAKVTREPECDLPGGKIALAPSNRVIFNAAVRDTLATHQDELIPCYKVLHDTIRIRKTK